jgi:glucosamine--fructose-6-phosphate aminotransferase (isomerizing)
MCGIVGAVAGRDIVPVLIEGLRRLEYRGYDSAGVAVVNGTGKVARLRTVGKVKMLQEALQATPTKGHTGIAHTRWATHGVPSERNAHPHISRDGLAIVHNGIIENHDELRAELRAKGYEFTSETDTEVIAHRIHFHMQTLGDLFKAVRATVAELEGAYALVVLSESQPDRLILARMGCPVVVGLGEQENFVASDVAALLPVTRRFIFLEEGDVAEVGRQGVRVLDAEGKGVTREEKISELSADAAEKGQYAHYMLKEIHEQPLAVANTLLERVANGRLLEAAFGPRPRRYSRMWNTCRSWPAAPATTPASWRVFHRADLPHSLLASRSPANTATATRWCRRTRCSSRSRSPVKPPTRWRRCGSPSRAGYLAALAVCNAREFAGARVGPGDADPRRSRDRRGLDQGLHDADRGAVAAGDRAGQDPWRDAERERGLVTRLIELPGLIEKTLALDPVIRQMAERFVDKHHALFLGRGALHPVAMEGALKLKEISYIHAEAYAAGELKHGPLALVDADMPVVTVAPNNDLLEKLKSNLMEVRARGGELYVFADPESGIEPSEGVHVIHMPRHVSYFQSPIIYTLPLQLLAYHVAILRGTDVDQPRNLAKSVTVE